MANTELVRSTASILPTRPAMNEESAPAAPAIPQRIANPMTTAVPMKKTLGEVLRRSNPQMHTARPGSKTVAAELDFNHLVNEKKATGTMANIASEIDKAVAWAAPSVGDAAIRWVRYPQAAMRRSHL